ncbi:MAG: hypothetical protein K2M79_04765 [Muribaculaceae bacterium]|nr:hypothetical protein [Muribaculaceae bacterium]
MLKKIKKILLGTSEPQVKAEAVSEQMTGMTQEAHAQARDEEQESSVLSAREEKPASTVNAVDRSSFLVEEIARALQPTAGAGGVCNLTVWVNDPYGMDDALVESGKFRKGLINELYERGLDQYCAGDFNIQLCAPDDKVKAIRIDDHVSISVGGKAVKTPAAVEAEATELRLTLLGGGQMAQPEYVFDATPGKKMEINIGRQRSPMVNGVVKLNQVVVNDGEPDAESGVVSRRHARILYNGVRFTLQAYAGGCTAQGGASTRLCHCEDTAPAELTSIFAAHPLRDGDVIILGKKVSVLVNIS